MTTEQAINKLIERGFKKSVAFQIVMAYNFMGRDLEAIETANERSLTRAVEFYTLYNH